LEVPHLQVRVRAEDKDTRISTLRMRAKDEGCWRFGIYSGDLTGDTVFIVEMRHVLRETHLQHPSRLTLKKFLLGDAVSKDSAFLVEI
jgi:hypothetical protein